MKQITLHGSLTPVIIPLEFHFAHKPQPYDICLISWMAGLSQGYARNDNMK